MAANHALPDLTHTLKINWQGHPINIYTLDF